VNSTTLLNELRLARELVTALVETLDDTDSRRQFHPELSPLGWHLGHCTWTECYWLQEVVGGDDRYTRPLQALYTPAETPKPARGNQLPALNALLEWTHSLQAMNDAFLTSHNPLLRDHELMQDNYLLHFLVQHYSQHYEVMLMVLAQRASQAHREGFEVRQPLAARTPDPDLIAIQPGHYRVGGHQPVACDNELPQQQVTLGPYSIATRPVSNAEYLAFMQDGGYQERNLWSDSGWSWLQQNSYDHPDHWALDDNGNWYGIAARGPYTLADDDAVSGLSFHEAAAYANRAGGRLPHEHQWEVACKLHALEDTGRAWEWCGNTFYPYDGYRPFPYAGYSQPWFDGNHYSLRGGSLHTRPSIKRASFRNFYQPDKRHIFAGLRLAYDTATTA
jgi:iron(II)-dependent oxidoreductase